MTKVQRSLPGNIAAFYREGRRRKVWTTAAAYLAVSIGVIEIAGAVASALLFPDWTQRLVTFLLIVGFPVVLTMAWIFDIGPGGSIQRTPQEGTGPEGTESSRVNRVPLRRRDRPPPLVPVERTRPAAAASDVASAQGPSPPPDPDRVRRAALAHVRHELRTPISAILGYSELIMEEEPGPEMEADLRKIHQAGTTLLALVDRILNPAQLAGSIDRDLATYAEEVRVGLRTPINSVIGYTEILIEGERDAGRTTYIADLERIHSAAQTLLAHSGDMVSVALAAPDQTGTRADVPDALGSSSRMAEGVLASIAPSGEGTGRGPDGQGTLLVVDDNPTSRDLLARQLAGHGYIVDTAEDGAKGLERARAGSFDLILLDVIMPVMDGVETLRHLKADEALRDIPVVMLSALDETEGALSCLELGAEEYLAKPVQPRLLEARIAANVALRRLREHDRLLQERMEEDEAIIERLLGEAFPPAAAACVSAGGAYRGVLQQATVLVCRVDPQDAPPGAGTPSEHLSRLSDLCAAGERDATARGLDAYAAHREAFVVAVSGTEDAPGDLDTLADLALSLLCAPRSGEEGPPSWPVRAALHAGPAVAGVIGERRPRFDLWGEAVDTAGLLAAQAEPGTILVSPTAHPLLDGSFQLESAGITEVPGKGRMRLYALRGARS